jgi:hypothetical protein
VEYRGILSGSVGDSGQNCGRFGTGLGQNCGRFGTDLGQNLVAFLGSIFTPFLRPAGETICLYMDVSGDWSAGRDPFSDHFWTVLLPMFSGTWKSEYTFSRT